MKAAENRAAGPIFARPGGALRLSNAGQSELLRGFAERGKTLRMRALGASMHPFIRNGDTLTLSPPGSSVPRIGEVFAFCLPGSGRLVIHRIVARRKGGWLTRGDNSRIPDGIIRDDLLIGRVTAVERCGRTVRWGGGPGGRVIALLVRANCVAGFRTALRGLRRSATGVLRRFQGIGPVRSAGRRLFGDVTILEARTGGDGPDGSDFPEGDGRSAIRFEARRSGRLLGTALLAPGVGDDGCRLVSLTVRTRYRGQGAGQALCRRALERSALEGATRLRVSVPPEDDRALRFFHKLGFAPDFGPAGGPPGDAGRVVLSLRWTAGGKPGREESLIA
jgi:GNAT superfamily N-acetyltransferase